jgi:hypothetical protein
MTSHWTGNVESSLHTKSIVDYLVWVDTVSGLPELLEPPLEFHPDMFDDLEFLPDALASEMGHTLPLQQA